MTQPSSERYPNRLITTASPYLLQHAHNPVDWFPWGSDALDKAKREDKPILVSIGYSTCHWCHVMERESFEDDAIASYMNQHFVNIKVDREERPDIDQLYMDAVQMISGSGGWPLNCFLTPDGRPFYGGTYFPPQPMGNRPSWSQVLQHLHNLYQDKREVVESQADKLIQAVRDHQVRHFQIDPQMATGQEKIDRALVDQIYHQVMEDRDQRFGGFGPAPKFPRTMSLEFLLNYTACTGVQEGADHVLYSLEKMVRGGIYDQIGGGMARYATDPAWLVPHFEKMLYDNALLVDILSKWCAHEKNHEFEQVVRDTIQWANAECSHPLGAFYSALDADSEGEEGKFYVWTYEEFVAVASEHTDLWLDYMDITREGNWENKNILHRRTDDTTFADRHQVDLKWLQSEWRNLRSRLYDTRAPRIRPGLDDKVILSWNALMVEALLSAYKSFGDPSFLNRAEQAFEFIFRHMRSETGTYFRIYAGGHAYQPAFLDDYAFLIRAMIRFLEINYTSEGRLEVQRMTDHVIDHFYDPEQGAFRTSAEASLQSVLFDTYDNALPSGNAVMAEILEMVHTLTGEQRYGQMALRLRERVRFSVERYPSSFAQYAQGFLAAVFGRREIVITGAGSAQMLKEVNAMYIPGAFVMASEQEDDSPLLENRVFPGKTYLYLCRDHTCQRPVCTVRELVDQL
ncbi:MAG: thioredoxin domain-containing protein [Saprospiraceae bacterium]|nr:thioredoxin domain-containing protein [Saprospiraceae bacterium]